MVVLTTDERRTESRSRKDHKGLRLAKVAKGFMFYLARQST